MKKYKFWYSIPLCVSVVFMVLSFISKKLIEMNVNTDVIPFYSFTIYVHTLLLFTIPIFIYVFLAFGINFTTIITSTEREFPLNNITKWLAVAFVFPLITESFYAINYYMALDTIIMDNEASDNIDKIGAFTVSIYILVNYIGWLCVLLFMWSVQYLKYGISFISSMINTFMFVTFAYIFYALFKVVS